jgi:hypothetical protein
MKLRKKVKVLEQMIAEQDDKIESLGNYGIKLNYEDKSSDNLRAKIVSQLDKLIGEYDIDTFEVENVEGAEIDYTNIRKDFKLYPSITVKFKEKKQNKTEIHNPRYDNRI